MTGIAIYMEGGGAKAEGKAALRIGMGAFLSPLRDLARANGLQWKIVACGSRTATLEAFTYAVAGNPETACMLLVDADAEVKTSTAEHLRRQGLLIPAGLDSNVYLMAQVMETWIIADPGALQRFYGQHFGSGALPRSENLETVDKTAVLRSLQTATARTSAGVYHKIRHGSKLLERIAADAVRRRCSCCDGFLLQLERSCSR